MHEGFVRILMRSNPDKFVPVGAGILVSCQSILTCAHVVNSALNLPQGSSQNPGGEIWLDFPFIAPKKYLKSCVATWHPPREEMQGDIAGLHLLDDLPKGAIPLQLVETRELWEIPFRAFGFPASYDDGIYARGALIDYTASGWLQVEGNFESSTRIQPGFSGGPIWVENLEGVVAMIVMAEKHAQSRLAFAIATQTLVNAWPELRDLAQQRTLDDSLRKNFLIQSAELRREAHERRDLDWLNKGYQNSSMPALEPALKDQIFSSRSRELEIGFKTLKDHRMLLITGLPGIGKSILARALLELMPIELPPAFWYDFEHQQSSGNTLGVVLDKISGYLEPLLGPEARDALLSYRQTPLDNASAHEVDILTELLNSVPTPVWLVFDNLEIVLSRGEDRFRDEGLELLFAGLKKNTHKAKIIITSSLAPKLGRGASILEYGGDELVLGGLDDASAVSFLKANGLQRYPEDALINLSHRVEGHPFALIHVAHFVEDLGIKAALENLKESLVDAAQQFESILQQRLSPVDFVVLQALSILRRPAPREGLSRIGQCDLSTIRRLRAEGLLDKNENDEFRVQGIVRNLLTAASSDVLQQAHTRAMGYYRELNLPIARINIDQYAAVFEWHYHAVQAGDLSAACKALFGTGLADHLIQWNEFSLLGRMSEDILAKMQLGVGELAEEEQVKLYHTLGILYYFLGDNEKSVMVLRKALGLIEAEENEELRARVLIDLAESCAGVKELDLAMDYCGQALVLISMNQEDRSYARAIQLRGIIYRLQGNMISAMADLELARDLFEKLGDATGTAYVTGELGIAYFYQNRFDKALENYRLTIVSCEQNRDLRGAMIMYYNVGDILLQQEDYQPASQQLTKSLDLARKMKFPRFEALAGLNLVESQLALHQLDEARQNLQSLASVVEKQNSPRFSGTALRLQAFLFGTQGQPDEAVQHFEMALDLLQGDDCLYDRARCNLAYANFLREKGQIDQARDVLAAARSEFTSINSELGLQAIDRALQILENG